MNRIALPHTGRSTSQLGFGGSALMGAAGRRESLALLEHAFEAGIRHFDVAPLYGFGAAEGCLGEFLGRHPGELTVTTKYGIPPPAQPGLLRLARRAVGPVLKAIPGLKQRLRGAANTAIAATPRAPFTAQAAQASLANSLRELRVDRIDLFLLHEAEAGDLQDDQLLRFLENAVAAGTVGAFGCGSTAASIPALRAHQPAYCRVLQFEWSVLDRPVDAGTAFTLHHRSLTANFSTLAAALRANAALCRRWSESTGADLARPGTLNALMLKAALVHNPGSIILVSSRNPAHIQSNVRVAGDSSLVDPARRLYDLAQAEGASLLAPP